MKKYLILTLFLLISASAFAGDISGKWIAQLGNAGEREFIFQVTEGKLSGTVTNFSVEQATFEQPGQPAISGILRTMRGKALDIIEGQVNGDEVMFVAAKSGRFLYTGKISGDEMKLKLVDRPERAPADSKPPAGAAPPSPPPPMEMVAKRVSK
jgi:hypothetical protein